MELSSKYLVAIALGMIVLAVLIIFLIPPSKNVPKTISQEHAFQRGCYILQRNGCDFDIVIDGKNFRDIINEMGYSEDAVRRQCCITGSYGTGSSQGQSGGSGASSSGGASQPSQSPQSPSQPSEQIPIPFPSIS